MYEDIAIELARTVRECTDVVERRLRDRQLGEAWIDLDKEEEECSDKIG